MKLGDLTHAKVEIIATLKNDGILEIQSKMSGCEDHLPEIKEKINAHLSKIIHDEKNRHNNGGRPEYN